VQTNSLAVALEKVKKHREAFEDQVEFLDQRYRVVF
jgi:predicted nucleotidyltransferase